MCISTAQARRNNRWARAGAFLDVALAVVLCTCSELVVRSRRKGNLVVWWSNFLWHVEGIGAALLRCADFVAGAALWTR